MFMYALRGLLDRMAANCDVSDRKYELITKQVFYECLSRGQSCCSWSRRNREWEERAGGNLHCAICGKKFAYFRDR